MRIEGMNFAASNDSRRAPALVAVAALHVLIAWILLAGLSVTVAQRLQPVLQMFEIKDVPPPIPPKNIAQRQRAPRKAGAAAPVNRRAKASPIVAPVPVVVPLPLPSIAAVVVGAGADANAGAAPIVGPGTGSGGSGAGTGSGDAGDGDGGGGGTPLRWRSGRIGNGDYPPGPLKAGIGGTVHLRFVVGADGRAHDCEVTRTSGNDELDATTCRLIEKRLRYRPELDAAGRPVAVVVNGRQVWETGQRPDALVDHGWSPPQ